MPQVFTVYRDGPDWIVAERQTARSFAMVPVVPKWDSTFSDEEKARLYARHLTACCAKGHTVKVRMIETPDRFEAVADTVYGPAWD